MQDYEQIKIIIGTLKKTINAMRSCCLRSDDLDNIQLIVQEINQSLYKADKLKFQKEYNWNDIGKQCQFADEIEKLISIWENSIVTRNFDKPDNGFYWIYDYFRYVDRDIIFSAVLQHFYGLPEGVRIEYLAFPYIYPYMQGKIDIVEKDFSLLAMCVDLMVCRVEQYRWLYKRLADHDSRMTLNYIIKSWCVFRSEIYHKINFEDFTELTYTDDCLIIDAKGAEMETICEEKAQIVSKKPRMLISLWYRLENLFDIPWFIDNIRGDYKFYLKMQYQNGIWPCEYALYLV